MDTSKITVGTKVMKSGYKGTVIEVCAWDTEMLVVRLDSGETCVSRDTFGGRYEGHYIISL